MTGSSAPLPASCRCRCTEKATDLRGVWQEAWRQGLVLQGSLPGGGGLFQSWRRSQRGPVLAGKPSLPWIPSREDALLLVQNLCRPTMLATIVTCVLADGVSPCACSTTRLAKSPARVKAAALASLACTGEILLLPWLREKYGGDQAAVLGPCGCLQQEGACIRSQGVPDRVRCWTLWGRLTYKT